MRIRMMMAVALVAFSPWANAQADKEVADESRAESAEGVIHIPEEDPIITIDTEGLGEIIEEVMEAIERALEGGQFALNSALKSSNEALELHRVAKAESGDSRPVDETKSTGARPDVEIYNLAGSVRVIGTGKNEVRIEGTLGEDVEELEFDVSNSSVDIRVRAPKGRNRMVKSDLTIYVPSGSKVEVKTVSASIEIENIKGDSIDLKSVSGGISVKDCAGELEISTTSGGVKADGVFDEVEIDSMSGPIRVTGEMRTVDVTSMSGPIRIEGAQESVEVESVSGPVTIEAGTLEELDVETVSSPVHFTGMASEDADFEVNTLSGSVQLTFDREVFGEYDIRTFSGGISSDFGPAPVRAGRIGPGKKLQFTHGDGDADIVVKTFSGSVTIKVR